MSEPPQTKILLVNDRADQLLAWEAILAPLDQTIVKAVSGQDALRYLLNDDDFAVILLDIKMPTMDGFETAKLIRQRKRNENTPILFITADKVSLSDKFVGYALGAVDYIISPIESEILLAKVRVFVDLYLNSIRIRESEQNFRQLTESIQEVFWMITADLEKIIYVSPLYEKIWRRPLKELLDNSKQWWHETIFTEDLAIILKTLAKLRQGKKSTLEFRILMPDHSLRWIQVRAYPLFDKNDAVYRLAGVADDVTERKQLEELTRRQKYYLESAELQYVNSIAEIISGIADELNQPLAAIATYTHGCIRKLSDHDYQEVSMIDVLKKVAQQAEKAGAIIHQIQQLIDQRELSYEYLSINELIQELYPLFNYEKSHTTIHIHLELLETIPSTCFDKIQIKQVILNLVRNAIAAMQSASVTEPKVIIRTLLIGKQIIVSILDNGPGLNQEKINRIFKTSISSKGNNIGMGLAISRTIIEAHGGQLSCKRNNSGGATFQFSLPLTESSCSNLLKDVAHVNH